MAWLVNKSAQSVIVESCPLGLIENLPYQKLFVNSQQCDPLGCWDRGRHHTGAFLWKENLVPRGLFLSKTLPASPLPPHLQVDRAGDPLLQTWSMLSPYYPE